MPTLRSSDEAVGVADHAAKRRIFEILCLNGSLVDVSLSVSMRKPFDLLAKGLILKDSRGERIRTYDPLVPKHFLPNAKNLKFLSDLLDFSLKNACCKGSYSIVWFLVFLQ